MTGDRADLAEAMVPVACDLACLVRDGDRDAIAVLLAGLTEEESRALHVVQAAMVPLESPVGDLLAWVGPVQIPALCGTYAAYMRHKRAGESIDRGCRAAARAYWGERNRARGPEAEAQDAATGEAAA